MRKLLRDRLSEKISNAYKRTLAGYSAHMAEHVTAEELARLQGVTSVDDPNAIAPQADPFGSDDE